MGKAGRQPVYAVQSLMRMNSEINITGILPSVPVPTLVLHRTEDPTVGIEGGRFLAKHIPGAKLVELDGTDHIPWLGNNAAHIADMILDFIADPGTVRLGPTGLQRRLATILFTDIVGSTDRARQLGDKVWRELLDAHDTTVRREIARFRGREVRTLGDGFLAIFDGRLGQFGVQERLTTRWRRLASRSAQACTRARWRGPKRIFRGSPFTLRRASWARRRQAKWSFREQ